LQLRLRRLEELEEEFLVPKAVVSKGRGLAAEELEAAVSRIRLAAEYNREAGRSVVERELLAVKSEREEVLRRRIEELRAPLRAVRKDIREVEAARLEAHEILHGEEIADPDLRRELEAVYRELDELRNEILRASEGLSSNERAKNFEEAIEKYRSALRAGYDVIVDDMTGEPIEVAPALQRTLQAYWADLRERSRRRYNEALRALKDGYPETAVYLLEEAEGLMKKVEEGGEEIRRQVDEALVKAREELHNKQRAQQLVAEAEAAADPEEARLKLAQARQYYPRYPGLDDMIAATERLVLAQVVRTIAVDISEARGALVRRDFEAARNLCRTALRRGANLSLTSRELEEKRQEVQDLLQEIDATEKELFEKEHS